MCPLYESLEELITFHSMINTGLDSKFNTSGGCENMRASLSVCLLWAGKGGGKEVKFVR